jgi:hypothetical protein
MMRRIGEVVKKEQMGEGQVKGLAHGGMRCKIRQGLKNKKRWKSKSDGR